MQKQYNIRWRESDRAELARQVRNFNERVRMAKKRDPAHAHLLPEHLTVNKVMSRVQSRKDLNRELRWMQKFTAKTAKVETVGDGAKVTKWAKDKAIAKDKEYTRQNKKRLEKEGKLGGKGLKVPRSLSGGTEDVLRTDERDIRLLKTQQQWDNFIKSADAHFDNSVLEARRERMRENYIQGLRDAGVLNADPEIENLIRSVDFDTFYETQQIDTAATFKWYKDPIGFQVRVDTIRAAWEAAKGDGKVRKK